MWIQCHRFKNIKLWKLIKLKRDIFRFSFPDQLSNFGFLPSEVCHQYLTSVSDIEDLHGAIRRTGGQSRAVVIHLGIVLKHRETNDV